MVKTFYNITHWHEHEIHEQISNILGYDTWKIGEAKICSDNDYPSNYNLTLHFGSRKEYEMCIDVIFKILDMEPE